VTPSFCGGVCRRIGVWGSFLGCCIAFGNGLIAAGPVFMLDFADDDRGIFGQRAHRDLGGAVKLVNQRSELLGGPAPGD